MAVATTAIARVRTPEPEAPPDVRRVVLSFGLMTAGLCALGIFVPIQYGLLIAVPVLAVWFWRAPFRAIYLLTAGAVMIEIFPLSFPDSLTDRIPLFLNLNNSAGLNGVPITPAEILMLTAGAVILLRGASENRLHWPSGRLAVAYGVYILVVLGAEVHGLLSGGDLKTSLWELRPQVYGFVLFLMTTTLVDDQAQVKRLAIVFLLAVMVKAVIGDFRYFVTLRGDLGSQLYVLGHEDSYFLSLFITAGLVSAIWLQNRRLTVLVTLGSILAAGALLANSRRIGIFALAGAVAVVLLLAYRYEPTLRKRIGWACVLVAVVGAGFLVYAWDKQYGIQAQLVRPIRSLVDPSARDFSSDQYRLAETANLKLTFQTNPIVGVGFGSPFLIVYPMADISNFYPLWNVIPHNSLMWVEMRMGTIGMVAFWGWIGIAVLEGFGAFERRRDPLVRAVAAFALAAIVAEIAVAYADLQLESYRNLLFLGVVLGVLNRLPQLPGAADE